MSRKYYVGVSGHRNLKQDKLIDYSKQLIEILEKIVVENKDKEVVVLSPIADGADRLMVYSARSLGLKYGVLLPMKKELYEMDFDSESLKEFEELLENASNIEELELYDWNTYQAIATYGAERDKQYQKVGKEIVDRSDLMVFLWDQKDINLVGGTSDIFKYAQSKKKKYLEIICEREVN